MLREFNREDKEQLLKIVKQGIPIICQDKIDHITGKACKIVVYDDNETGLRGFGSFRRWGIDKKRAEVGCICCSRLKKKRNWDIII